MRNLLALLVVLIIFLVVGVCSSPDYSDTEKMIFKIAGLVLVPIISYLCYALDADKSNWYDDVHEMD